MEYVWERTNRVLTETRNCYEHVSERTDGTTGERVAARPASLRRHASAAGWPTSSTEGAGGAGCGNRLVPMR